jgi:hypothetical protein
MFSEILGSSPEIAGAILLMPPRQVHYKVDATIYEILSLLRERGWKSEGIDVEIHEMHIRYGEEGKYTRAAKISGKDFEICFHRNRDPESMFAPLANLILIPGKLIYLPVPNDHYGPTLYVHDDNVFLRQRWLHNPELIAKHGCVRYENYAYHGYVAPMEEPGPILSKYLENQSRVDLGQFKQGIGQQVLVSAIVNEFDAWLIENVLKPLRCA